MPGQRTPNNRWRSASPVARARRCSRETAATAEPNPSLCGSNRTPQRATGRASTEPSARRSQRYGTATEPWAILRRHPVGSDVGEHSINACLVGGVRKVVSRREAATQRAERPDRLRSTGSVNRRCGDADRPAYWGRAATAGGAHSFWHYRLWPARSRGWVRPDGPGRYRSVGPCTAAPVLIDCEDGRASSRSRR